MTCRWIVTVTLETHERGVFAMRSLYPFTLDELESKARTGECVARMLADVLKAARIGAILDTMERLEKNEPALDVLNNMLLEETK